MCNEEFIKISNSSPFSWNKKCKWFTSNENFLKRVQDGRFNNSKFKSNRYTHLVKYHVKSLDGFIKVSDNELMLYRCKQPMIQLIGIEKCENYLSR